jgi:hypothetical protein
MTQSSEGHSIPRLYKLGYLEVALLEAADRASFERIRQVLIGFAAAQKGEERMAVSRIRDAYTFWSPTQEALAELMRLGFIGQIPLPSERKYVDAYRQATYEVTTEGEQAAKKLRSGDPHDRADFLNMLSVALAEAHPGFATLLSITEQSPLCIPEYTIEKISNLAAEGPGSLCLAQDAISRMTEHWREGVDKPKTDDLAAWITDALDRRFPRSRLRSPSQKDVLDTVDDAILGFAARSRGIHLDAISFNVCIAWASQLALLEESRYVEGWLGRTVWATARIQDHSTHRRGFQEAGEEVIQSLRAGFRKVAEAMPEARASGFLPIYQVRAQAAFTSRVNLRFVDMILARLLSGELAAPYMVRVSLGRNTRPPPSEPIFTHQGRRFFEIMITEKENEDASEKPVETR